MKGNGTMISPSLDKHSISFYFIRNLVDFTDQGVRGNHLGRSDDSRSVEGPLYFGRVYVLVILEADATEII